jgi:hypothetical protein
MFLIRQKKLFRTGHKGNLRDEGGKTFFLMQIKAKVFLVPKDTGKEKVTENLRKRLSTVKTNAASFLKYLQYM